jgi:hypothetical protein
MLLRRNFLEPNRRLVLEKYSYVRDSNVRDFRFRDDFIRLR